GSPPPPAQPPAAGRVRLAPDSHIEIRPASPARWVFPPPKASPAPERLAAYRTTRSAFGCRLYTYCRLPASPASTAASQSDPQEPRAQIQSLTVGYTQASTEGAAARRSTCPQFGRLRMSLQPETGTAPSS